jgi:tryptophan synthase alpha chain
VRVSRFESDCDPHPALRAALSQRESVFSEQKMTRIEKRFAELKAAGKKAFIPYLTAGDPSLDTTRDLVLALEKAGADVIELGVPFSDPIADGPVIQRATERALRNGVTLQGVLELGKNIRKMSEIPLVLFSYFNPLLNHGLEKLARDAASAGFDGILASDLTVEESEVFSRSMRSAGLNTVFLVAPTSSPERMKKIARASSGFLYAVSRTGVTGETQELSGDLKQFLRTLRTHTKSPIAVGFGISRPEHVRAVWQEADGAIVGSSIVKEVEQNCGKPDLVERVAAFASWLKDSQPK